MVIIDEVSMVRSDIMQSIDRSLRANRKALDVPFGGVQMVFVGDLFQLPPVLTNYDKDLILRQYGSSYFFSAPVFDSEFQLHKKELTKIFRQKDAAFIKILNRLRVSNIQQEDFTLLNSRHVDKVGESKAESVYLTTTNQIVHQVNHMRLQALTSKEFCYVATFTGSMSEKYEKLQSKVQRQELSCENYERRLENEFPCPVMLKLKVGAQIMLVRNDQYHRWVNGSVGVVTKLSETEIGVRLQTGEYTLAKESWDETEYHVDKDEISQSSKGTFTQFPIRLAWAITIHKCQGMTMDNVTIDLGSGTFAHGQAYVALSRVKSLAGLFLKRHILPQHIIVDKNVLDFSNV